MEDQLGRDLVKYLLLKIKLFYRSLGVSSKAYTEDTDYDYLTMLMNQSNVLNNEGDRLYIFRHVCRYIKLKDYNKKALARIATMIMSEDKEMTILGFSALHSIVFKKEDNGETKLCGVCRYVWTVGGAF